ncbi:MAG: DUF3857 domain-containing protein [Gammaproteobacteria bacterium]|nr:MAG: DUF3857 domain-containing protein [Gammaproteobacteria bacterium]
MKTKNNYGRLLFSTILLLLSFKAYSFQKSINFTEDNFKFTIPDNGYIKIPSNKVAKNSIIAYQVKDEEIYFSIIVDKINPHYAYSAKKYSDFCITTVKNGTSDTDITLQNEHYVNGYRGYLANIDYVFHGTENTQFIWTYSKNGFLYQLFIYGVKSKKDLIKKHSDYLFSNFHVLDNNHQAPVKDELLFKRYRSYKYGYYLDLRHDNWMKWASIGEKYPSADIGIHKSEKAGAVIFTFPVYSKETHLEAVTNVLTKAAGVAYPNEYIKNFHETEYKKSVGYTFDYIPPASVDNYNYRFKLYSTNKICYMLFVLHEKQPDAPNKFDDKYNDFFKSFKIEYYKPQLLSEQEKKKQAALNNSLGLFYYNNKNYFNGIKFFAKALELSNHKASYLQNYLSCLTKVNRFKDAFDVIKKYKAPHADNPEIIAWNAWLLYKNNHLDDSEKEYNRLFNKGYKNDDDFIIYIDLLQELNKKDLAIQQLKAYIKKQPSYRLKKYHAKKLYDFGRYKQAIKLLEDLQKGRPFITELQQSLANNYLQMQRYKEALNIADKIIKKGYASTDAYSLKGEALYGMKNYREAKQSFEKALDYSPQSQYVKEYIQHISGLIGEGSNSNLRKKITPVTIPENLKAQINDAEKTKFFDNQAGSTYIYRIKGYSFKKGEKLKTTTYRKIKLTDNSNISKFSTLKFIFNPLYEEIYVNHLKVFDAHGKLLSTGNRSSYYITDNLSNNMATHEKVINIPVPNLKAGNIIDIVYTSQTNAKLDKFGFEREFLFATTPVILNAVFIKADSSDISYRQANIAAPVVTDNHIIWTQKNSDAFRREPYQIELEEISGIVEISSANEKWKQIAKEHYEKIKPKLKIDEKIKIVAKKLTKKAASIPEKINILADYVQKTITYKPIEFGSRGQIPNTAIQTLENKYGDCKDHAVLLYAMLASINIESNLALVNSIYKVNPEIPSLDQFNHVINYIPSINTFLDTTDKGISLNSIVPAGLGNKHSLLINKKNPAMLKIPDYNKNNSILKTEKNIHIKTRYLAQVNETVTLKGYTASFMRNHIKTIEKSGHIEWGQQLINSYLPGAQLNKIDIKNSHNTRKPLIMKLNYDVTNHSNIIDNKLIAHFPVAWERYYLSTSPVYERKTDFKIYYPFKLISKNSLTFDKKFKLNSTENINESGKSIFSDWKLSINHKANRIDEQFIFNLKTGKYDKEQYSDFFEESCNILNKLTNNIYYSE